MNPQLLRQVRSRAAGRCEYCHLTESFAETPFQVDHIIAEKHGGPTHSDNLAWACFYCNNYKGPNIAGIDPDSGALTRLFNPRTDRWSEHFELRGAILIGLTPVGKTTIRVLNVNLPDAVALRELVSEMERRR